MKMQLLSLNLLLTVGLFIFFLGCQTKGTGSSTADFPDFYKEGHRGIRGLMPENTIMGMKRAIDDGANIIEVDIFTSKDQKVIVTHDAFINPVFSLTPDGNEIPEEDEKKYAIHQMDYADIRKFDIGSKGNPEFPQQKKAPAHIPLLSELIDEVEAYTSAKNLPEVIYNIELKSSVKFDSVYNSKPEELVDATLDIVKSRKIGDRFYIQSFDVRPLQYIHEKYPDIVIGYLVSRKDTFEENINELGFMPDIYSPKYTLVTTELVEKCKKEGCKLVPWTVNTKEEMQQLIQMGVDGIITDYPNWLSELDI